MCVVMPALIITDDGPKSGTAIEPAECSEWMQGISEEFTTLKELKTWEEGFPPPNIKVIPSDIMLKLKRYADGRPDRFKARLVVRGNFQDDQFEFGELYTPVACTETVRLIISVAAVMRWTPDHIDMKGAFLYASLEDSEELWIRLPNIPGIFEALDERLGYVSLCMGYARHRSCGTRSLRRSYGTSTSNARSPRNVCSLVLMQTVLCSSWSTSMTF